MVTKHMGTVTTALNVTVPTTAATGYEILTKTITNGDTAIFHLSQKRDDFVPGLVQQLGENEAFVPLIGGLYFM